MHRNSNVSVYYHKTVVYGIVGIMLIPIVATLVYSLSSSWGRPYYQMDLP